MTASQTTAQPRFISSRAVATSSALCCLLGLAIALHAAPSRAQSTFDFDTGNAAVEIVIPGVVPVIFESVAPGDATIVLRFTTLLTNAWFDATAPYHPTAVGVYSRLGRRPPSESLTNANMNVALLYASLHVLKSLAPHKTDQWEDMLYALGLDPNDTHEGTEDAIGIGNAAGRAVVAVREHDGFNQLGTEGRTYHPRPYADYTGYRPVNTAHQLWDIRRWQPDVVVNRYGIARAQEFVTPQYALTLPYSFEDPRAFSVPPPEKSYARGIFGLLKYRQQADEVLRLSANLTDEQKMMAELFDNKIRGLGFSSLFIAQTRGLSLLEFIHYDFTANLAAFDAGIVAWQEKTKYDSVRPFTAIRFLYGHRNVRAWGGPGLGTVNDMPGDEWRPYLQSADHPEYPSGSASFCAAHAQASRLFFGDDELGWTVPTPAGSSIVEPGVTPASNINLHWDTWTEFETDCGLSRAWAGVHFQDAIDEGWELGREIGSLAHAFVQSHVDGSAP